MDKSLWTGLAARSGMAAATPPPVGPAAGAAVAASNTHRPNTLQKKFCNYVKIEPLALNCNSIKRRDEWQS